MGWCADLSGDAPSIAWSGTPVLDATCRCHPLTAVSHLWSGPRRDKLIAIADWCPALCKAVSWSTLQIWTILQHDGPNRLGLGTQPCAS